MPTVDVAVCALSGTDFRALASFDTNDAVAGAVVTLDLPGIGEQLARLDWAKDGVIGGTFAKPLSPEQVETATNFPSFLAASWARESEGFDLSSSDAPDSRLRPRDKLIVIAAAAAAAWILVIAVGVAIAWLVSR
jgi:hypothetical protein